MSAAAALTLLAQTVPLQSVCVIGSGTAKTAADILRRRLTERGATDKGCATRIAFRPARLTKEAFRIDRQAATITVSAGSTRGFVYGAGWLLRHSDNLALALSTPIHEKPEQAIRGTQIGYRFKNNSYDAWTPAMLKRRIEDFALWGTNRIQIIAPRSDDAPTSPLMPVPPEQAVRNMAQATHDLGLDVAIFYPLLGDYDGGAANEAEARNLDALLKTLPALDALYFPGGDPGHTSPEHLFPLIERLAGTLRQRFPKAELLLSTQGFDAKGLDAFFVELELRVPAKAGTQFGRQNWTPAFGEVPSGSNWLTAIFVGPQTRESAATHLRRLAGRLPVELYPDTAHAMQAQFPIPDWHPAFALAQGREPVNPRPSAQTAIFAKITPGTRGAISYSEGINDDWNVHQWLAMGWNSRADIATDYANFYIGDPAFAAIPTLLETNWQGDPASNAGIDRTLNAIDAIHPAPWADWHLDLYRYRAVYDALIRERLTRARANQAEALYTLRQTPAIGAKPAVAAARFAYARPDSARSAGLYRRLTARADQLRATAGMQLSVERHGASNWRRGANFDRAMIDLNDRVAVERDMSAALALPTEAERIAALHALGDRWGMADFALYDDLGDPANEPHLVRGPGYPSDPQLWRTAIDGVAEHIPNEGWRMAELSYAEALFEQPLTLHYEGLEKNRAYRLRYTWAGEDYSLPLTLTANGTALPAPPSRTSNPQRVELPVPQPLTANGTLDLVWSRPPGMGGGGRGRQIAEVWLIPEALTSKAQP